MDKLKKECNYIYIWEYQVKVGHELLFEKYYGSEGDWVLLFLTSPHYLDTHLIRDLNKPGRYITIDKWESKELFDEFYLSNKEKFDQIDRLCECLTVSESLIGKFDNLLSIGG